MSDTWERERKYQNRLANKTEGRPEYDEMAAQPADADAGREPQLTNKGGGFLCLSRCVGRSVFIGDDIQVKIYGLCGPEGVPLDGISVRLAIKAPRGVLILRDENRERKDP